MEQRGQDTLELRARQGLIGAEAVGRCRACALQAGIAERFDLGGRAMVERNVGEARMVVT
jgi:hypothetical protein